MQQQRLKRVQREYSRIAKESVELESIGGAIYAFGTELAVLRLYRRFQGSGHSQWSANLNRWYFTPS